MRDQQGLFASPPPIQVEGDAADSTLLTLKAMILQWWMLAAAWISAGIILALLDQPVIALVQTVAGLTLDTYIQIHLRQRLARREAGAADAASDRGAGLGRLVFLRFTLGMAGALATVLWRPSLAGVCVLTLLQAWFLCVAVVQFAHAPRLLAMALAPVQAMLLVGLATMSHQPGAPAILAAVLLLNGVVIVVARELNQLSWTWISAARRNVELQKELIEARDEAVRANRAKSEFLAAMSHEIRTPLNGMLGMAQVMASHDLDGDQRDRLAVVNKSGVDLMTVLNDILDLSKVEAGRMELEDVEFDLGGLFEDMRASFQAVAAAKRIDLVLEADAPLGVVRGDAGRLRQILYNLLSNAVKFTEHGKVRLVARYAEGRLTAEVIDTGIGMSAATMAKLFQPYAQAEPATSRDHGGTGLGLAIARRLADLMGGALEASSALGQGSRFILTTPLTPGRPARLVRAATPKAPTHRMPRAAARPLRILAADDHPVNRQVLAALLKPAGVELTLVENGRLAVDAWIDAPWDLVLMDVQMPVLDGVDAVREIREREAVLGRARTPIIALTAHTLAHNLETYGEVGMDGHIAKPIDATRLYDVLDWATVQMTKAEGVAVAA